LEVSAVVGFVHSPGGEPLRGHDGRRAQ
jgi:hypothetical protein